MKTSVQTVRVWLSCIWFALAAGLFAILLAQSINDPSIAKTVWAWFTPLVVPGTGLIVGLWVTVAKFEKKELNLNVFSTYLSYGLVIFYFICLYATILSIPFMSFENTTFSEWLETSQLWIGAAQAPTLAVIGKIFAEN